MPLRLMDDIIADFKGTGNDGIILDKSIQAIQKILRHQDEKKKVSVVRMKDLLEREKNGKNRSTLKRWLEYGIEQGKLPDEFYLDYRAKAGLFKSALQKYIRRGMVDKAVRTAYTLFKMDKNSLTHRLHTILCEDGYTAIGAFPECKDNPIGVTKLAASLNSDGHCYRLAEHIILNGLFNSVKPNRTWLEANFLKGDIVEILAMLSNWRRHQHLHEIGRYFKDTPHLCFSILNQVEEDERWDGDILMAAAVRVAREGYDDITVPNVDLVGIEPISEDEFEWFVYDMHTYPGVVSMRQLCSKLNLTYKTLEYAWWYGASAVREPENPPTDDFKKFYRTKDEMKCLKLWSTIDKQVEDGVMHVVRDLFKIGVKTDGKEAGNSVPY